MGSYKLIMKEKKIKITNKLGLHARAAAKIVTLTNKFESIIKIVNGNKPVSYTHLTLPTKA